MRYCSDVAAELGLSVKDGYLPRECCYSCHDDYSLHSEPLIWLDDETQVCCAIARLVDSHGLEEAIGSQTVTEPTMVTFRSAVDDPDRPWLAEQAGLAACGKPHDPGPWCKSFNCDYH